MSVEHVQEQVVRAMDALQAGKTGDAYDVLHVALHAALQKDRCRFCASRTGVLAPTTSKVYPWWSRNLSTAMRGELAQLCQDGPKRALLLHKAVREGLVARGLVREEGKMLAVTERGQRLWAGKVEPIPVSHRLQCPSCDLVVDARVSDEVAHLRTHEASRHEGAS